MTLLLKWIIGLLDKGTEINAYYVNSEGEKITVYTDMDDKTPQYILFADVLGISVSDNGVLECEVEEP